jgi:hypothetical protein
MCMLQPASLSLRSKSLLDARKILRIVLYSFRKQKSARVNKRSRCWIATSYQRDGSTNYVAVERIPSYEAYQWMVDFVDELVAPADENAAEKLSIALDGKGAFRRFKDTLHRVDERWLRAWYTWRDQRLKAAVEEWIRSVGSTNNQGLRS